MVSFVLLTLLTFSHAEAAGVNNVTAREFIDDLRLNTVTLEEWVLPEELEISRRLDINYENITNKFLISYELPGITGEAQYKILSLDQDYSLLTITTATRTQTYYFFKSYLISPAYYFSRDWTRIESKYFVFVVSDPGRFNSYCMQKLDTFVEETSEILGISAARLQQLQEKKIHYYLCSDSGEIKNLTGYDARGMYVLAYDYIVSTFNCHYHEIVHLLVNFKLQQLPLLTHPFLQEGVAVALGGRGGKEPDVILNMGLYLERSGFSSYRELLPYNGFTTTDASLTYPVSGLYSEFLLESTGAAKYLQLYRKYSGDGYRSEIPTADLPSHEKWTQFLESYGSQPSIAPLPGDQTSCETIYSDGSAQVCTGVTHTRFKTRRPVLLADISAPEDYTSYLFAELFPDIEYRGEKFLVTSDNDEISVYDLFTNNLVAKYVTSMSREQTPIDTADGYRAFSITNSVFGSAVKNFSFRTLEEESSGE